MFLGCVHLVFLHFGVVYLVFWRCVFGNSSPSVFMMRPLCVAGIVHYLGHLAERNCQGRDTHQNLLTVLMQIGLCPLLTRSTMTPGRTENKGRGLTMVTPSQDSRVNIIVQTVVTFVTILDELLG